MPRRSRPATPARWCSRPVVRASNPVPHTAACWRSSAPWSRCSTTSPRRSTSPRCSRRWRSGTTRSTPSTWASACCEYSPEPLSRGRSSWCSTTRRRSIPRARHRSRSPSPESASIRSARSSGCRPTPSAWDDVVTRRIVLGPLGVSDLVAIVQHATDCGSDARARLRRVGRGQPDARGRARQLALRRRAERPVTAARGSTRNGARGGAVAAGSRRALRAGPSSTRRRCGLAIRAGVGDPARPRRRSASLRAGSTKPRMPGT